MLHLYFLFYEYSLPHSIFEYTFFNNVDINCMSILQRSCKVLHIKAGKYLEVLVNL